MTTKTWTVQVTLDEEGDDTLADAALSVENKMELRGRGASRRNPRDESEPRIGDELATARALSEPLIAIAATATFRHHPASAYQPST